MIYCESGITVMALIYCGGGITVVALVYCGGGITVVALIYCGGGITVAALVYCGGGITVVARLYFLRQLKRAKVPSNNLLLFYVTCIRPVTEYACQVFHDSLPQYLSDELEKLQSVRSVLLFLSCIIKTF